MQKRNLAFFVEITDKEDQKAHNIADTTPSKRRTNHGTKPLKLLRYIGIKTHYQEVIQLRYFQEMSCTRNDFHLLFAFCPK
jgi:RNA polymerase sigma-70 factor (ECF subfamily)